MAVLFQESFDIYGTGGPAATAMTQGRWAEMSGPSPQYPSFGARTGIGALFCPVQSGASFQGARLVLPSTYTTLFVSFGLYATQLPINNNTFNICDFRDNSNNRIGRLVLQSTGALAYINEASTDLGSSPNNAIVAGSWQHVAIKVVKSATVGSVEVRVDNITVLTLTNVNTGATAIAQLKHWITNADGGSSVGFYIDDLHVNDANGSSNNDFPGTVRVATIPVVADAPASGWVGVTRFKFGTGVAQFDGTDAALTCVDSAPLELSNGDYTIEGFFKFRALPTGSNKAVLFGKWRAATNERSYILELTGPSLGGTLDFVVSTDGTGATVTTIAECTFAPITGRWYHICVQRLSGNTVIFVDGVPLTAPKADANTYFDGTATFNLGGEQNGVASVITTSIFNGFIDEFRVTKGVARYNATGFVAPTAAFGRNSTDDPSFSSVSLLLGFNGSLVDDSSFARAVSTIGTANFLLVDDTPPGDYKTINQTEPRDDTYVEAAYTAATGVLTITGTISNGETVVFDGVTYTFNTVLGGAGSVLIGGSISASIDNLVAAINGDPGSGTIYGIGTTPSTNASALNIGNNQMRATANTPGTAGNSIGTTETLANGSWTASTLTGGLNIPGESEFLLGRLPSQTTGVRAASLVYRARKTDTGDANVQAALVTADNSSANGADRPISTSFTYYTDIITTDPSTSGALTPSTFVGAKLRLDRTL